MTALYQFLGAVVVVVGAYYLACAVRLAFRPKPAPPVPVPDPGPRLPIDTTRPWPRPGGNWPELDRVCPVCGMDDALDGVLLGWPAHLYCAEWIEFEPLPPGQIDPDGDLSRDAAARRAARVLALYLLLNEMQGHVTELRLTQPAAAPATVPFGPGGSFPGAADRPWSTAELPGMGGLTVRAWGENGVPEYRWRCLCGATAYGQARTPELAHASAVDSLGDHRRRGECRGFRRAA